MTAVSELRPANRSLRSVADRRTMRILPWLVLFSMFFPYPSLQIGRSSGLQICSVLCVVYLAFTASRLQPRHVLAYTAMTWPFVVSACVVVIFGWALDPTIAVKSAVIQAISALPLLVIALIVSEIEISGVIWAVSIAILIQAGVALWQVESFRHGQLPLVGLYDNASFASVKSNAYVITHYVRRPFGLFPEPSAMAACVVPWLAFLGVSLTRPTLKLTRRLRRYAVAAMLLGTLMVVLSKSGLAAALVAIYLVLGWPYLRDGLVRVRAGGALVTFIALAAVGLVAFGAVHELRQRHPFHQNLSYQSRSASIEATFADVDKRAWAIVVGLGPGQAALHLNADAQGTVFSGLPQTYVPEGVYSALVRVVVETGYLLGGFALLVIGVMIAKAFRRSPYPFGGWIVLFAWLAAVTAATSYLELAPPWAILGVLVGWEALDWTSGDRASI
jgi:hypothetical protein